MEKPLASLGAIPTVLALLAAPALGLLLFVMDFWVSVLAAPVLTLLFILVCTGVTVINPGQAQVIQLFGRYLGTNRRVGLSLVPPLTSKERVSIRIQNFETETLKVNDAHSNPVNVAAIVVWQVEDTAKAVFAVEGVHAFVQTQAEAALRQVARSYPYDAPYGSPEVHSLAGSTAEISEELAREIAERVAPAGVTILEARISSLSYAPEIAKDMLQRQQANAVIDAREIIVNGAVSIVEQALDQLDKSEKVQIDGDRRAAMVSNLLVVLCSDNSAQPVINTGSLDQ